MSPDELRTERLLLRPLRVTDVERDHEALMSSVEMLRMWSGSDWPSDDFSVEENRVDLERHEREHFIGEAYTFTVLDPNGRCAGCVYLMTPNAELAAACEGAERPIKVSFWVRAAEVATDLDRHLLLALGEWLRTWPYDRVIYTITQANTRQASLFADAGLVERLALTLADGRAIRVFA